MEKLYRNEREWGRKCMVGQHFAIVSAFFLMLWGLVLENNCNFAKNW